MLDVRTSAETAGGVIPGAILIPVDELEARVRELPKDGRATLPIVLPRQAVSLVAVEW